MQTLFRILVLCALALPCALQAGDTTPPMGGAGDAPPQALLDHLAGTWQITRHIGDQTAVNRATAEWVLGHQFIQLHMIDVASPPAYEAIVLMGYDDRAGDYVAYWCDSFGAAYAGVGRGKADGDNIRFEFKDPNGAFLNTFTWHGNEQRWTSYMENVDAGGQHHFFAEDTYRKAEGSR